MKQTTPDFANRTLYKYLSSLTDISSKEMMSIERALISFLSYINGYSLTARETEWPVLEPNFTAEVNRLAPFHEAYGQDDNEAIIHFFINDRLFLRLSSSRTEIPLEKCQKRVTLQMQYTL